MLACLRLLLHNPHRRRHLHRAEHPPEIVVEDAALGWLESLGYGILHGPDIAAGEWSAQSAATLTTVTLYWKPACARRWFTSIPDLPAEALEDAFRKLTRSDAPSLLERNRAVHRMLVDGVTVEYRRKDGSIAGAQAQVIDFESPENNDWLAVNQFTPWQKARRNNAPAGRMVFSYGVSRDDRNEQ